MNESDDYHQVSPLGLTFEEENIINLGNNQKKGLDTKKNFDKVIIPYNFKRNNYSVSDNEIEGYENKEFVLNTLHSYNIQKLFKFDSAYSPSFCERILLYFPMFLLILIILYILISLIILFLFNPLVIYISYKLLKGVYFMNKSIKNAIYEKLKKKAINKKLEETNKSQYCREHKIKWNLGVSGYWLEVEKINK